MPKAGSTLASRFSFTSAPVSNQEMQALMSQSMEDSGAYRTRVSAEMAGYASDYHVRIARDGANNIAGAIVYVPEPKGAQGYVYVYDVGVLNSYTGRGLGRQLMKQAAQYAASRGMGLMLTEVAESIGFYDRLGFEGSGVRRLSPEKTARLAR